MTCYAGSQKIYQSPGTQLMNKNNKCMGDELHENEFVSEPI